MQTFLPFENLKESAMCLDKKRCWKQVVEARQIIDVLEGKKVGWANHPAVKMWYNYEKYLKLYFDVFLEVCKTKHRINTKYISYGMYGRTFDASDVPWWFGKKKFHRSHRARLIEKDRDFYLPLFPNDEGYNYGKYWWPDMKTKTFKTI